MKSDRTTFLPYPFAAISESSCFPLSVSTTACAQGVPSLNTLESLVFYLQDSDQKGNEAYYHCSSRPVAARSPRHFVHNFCHSTRRLTPLCTHPIR